MHANYCIQGERLFSESNAIFPILHSLRKMRDPQDLWMSESSNPVERAGINVVNAEGTKMETFCQSRFRGAPCYASI